MYREASLFVIVAFGGKVFALDRVTGEIRWRVELDSPGPVELMIDDDLVVACGMHKLAFINYNDGATRRAVRRTDVASTGRPVFIADGDQILIAGSGSVACYSRTGDPLWEQRFSGRRLWCHRDRRAGTCAASRWVRCRLSSPIARQA